MISIVIPVFNEAESLPTLIERINATLETTDTATEIILVDDGSTDESWPVIESLADQNSHVRGIRFRRNFGKAAALAAGFDSAAGKMIITMDADLQDDPQEIPALIAKLNEGFDVVSGWKKDRHDPWHKTMPSKVFNWLVSHLTGVSLRDHNCGLKAYRSQVFAEVQLYGEMHRFVPVLAASRGFRVGEIPVQHHARKFGSSKYGFRRFFKGFLDLLTVYFLTGYGQRPQHLLGTIGLLSFGGGTLGMIVLTLAWIISRLSDSIEDVHLHDRAIFYYSIVALLMGVQLITTGFVAELITAAHRPHTSPYSIRESTNNRNE